MIKRTSLLGKSGLATARGCLFRSTLTALIFLGLFSRLAVSAADSFLPPWQQGQFDIHHIHTGRGNAAYLVFPDGTTLLVDAGDMSDTRPRTLSARNSARKPNASRSAPEWICDYVRAFTPAGQRPGLDYALITHYHDDHFGEWDPTRPRHPTAGYALTGIMAVGQELPIGRLLDRGSAFPVDLRSAAFLERYGQDAFHLVQTLQSYWAFIEHQQRQTPGFQNQELIPGARDQIVLRRAPARYPTFEVRNIAVNGKVWTGGADGGHIATIQSGAYPGENPLSLGLRIRYGAFDYFTGGDISGIDELGQADPERMEGHVGPVVGPVDVATLNHHGNRDSQSPAFVRALRPRVWVAQVWSSDHPGEEVLRRITSTKLYPGDRDLFALDMLEANHLVIGERITDSFRSLHGHVVVRVEEGGASYRVYVLNDASERREITGCYGPYSSR